MDLKSDACAAGGGGGPSQKKLKPESYYCDLSSQSLPPMTSLNQSFNMNSPNSASLATAPDSTNANTSTTNPGNNTGDLNKSNARLFDLNTENRVLVRSDTNWAPASNCDPLIHCAPSSLIKSTSLALPNHQQRSNQHQMINQDYFSPTNSVNHTYNPLPEPKVKSYFSPFINSNQQPPQSLNHQSFSNNYITYQPNTDRNYGTQLNLNLNAFDDNLTGFSNTHLNHTHQAYNNGQMQHNNLQHQHQHKTTPHSNFNSINDPLNGSGLPAASSMINTIVEDMTGTFSNSFAHEIIKSVDDNLFSFEEGLVCNFDIDQLDDAAANDVNLNAFYSSLKL